MQLLNLKTGITFGTGGNLQEFSPVGFSPAADDVSTWSEAATAELTFRLPPLRHDLRFIIEVFPFLANGQIAQQGCWIFFNGLYAHYEIVKTPVEMAFTIGRDLLSPRVNRLSFALPNAAAPSDLNLGNDLRLLGLAFVRLSVGDPSVMATSARSETSARSAAAPASAATARPEPAAAASAASARSEPLARTPTGTGAPARGRTP